ncbi:MAG: hypothetical protein HUU01_12635 [Saprospiraceae bacterium]|nr:hypothetical protein [Saprospiraceae bacterium]
MNRYFFYPFFIIAAGFIFPGCEEQGLQRILFLGHPYNWRAGDRVDPRVEALDLSEYNQIWLGGDVCGQTTKLPATLDYLDTLFDLHSDQTHWAWGNHDVLFGNTDQILAHTGKPDFYVSWQDGFCLLVLNTNLFWYYPSPPQQLDCEAKATQIALIKAVTDTIRKASHLVILHHHALFNEYKTDAPGNPANAFNGTAIPIRATCDSTSDLTKLVYPWLTAVQRRGVQVVMVGGDLGMRAKSFDQETPEGIRMLGSGINNSVEVRYLPDYVTSFTPDQVLILNYHRRKKTLDWTFKSLHELVSD